MLLLEERAWKETSLWLTCKRNRTWFFLSTHLHHNWRHGNCSNCGLQAASSNDCRKAWEAIQQNHPVDQMQVELFTTALSHQVSSRISVLTWMLSYQWRHHWPWLLNGQGPPPWLNNHTLTRLFFFFHSSRLTCVTLMPKLYCIIWFIIYYIFHFWRQECYNSGWAWVSAE